jgi:phosphonate transport system permease protein
MSANAEVADLAALKGRHPQYFRVNWRYRSTVIGVLAFMTALYIWAFVYFDVPWSRVLPGFKQLGWFIALMFPPSPGDQLFEYLNALGETLAIAFLGTLTGALFALPIGLLGARNIIPPPWLRLPFKRLFDVVRGIDTLIWALIWINVVGLGPFAGLLAIATSDFGSLGKLFAEIIESADPKEVEGIRASGGKPLAQVRFGVLPQVLPVIAGQILYYIESNTRSATIIGVVGAGGIGLHLSEQIRVLEWRHVSFLILLILISVAAIDFVSSRLRGAMAGKKAGRE